MGETLSTLAAVADVPVERILRRNCLPDDYQAITGDAILLPTEGEFGRVIAPDAPLDCSAPEVASFTTIQAGQTLSGQVEIRGVAGGADFRRYHLDIRPDGYLRPIAILSGNTPVNGRVLGLLETDDLPLGLAWLRLTIITGAGTMTDGQVCVIPVIIAR